MASASFVKMRTIAFHRDCPACGQERAFFRESTDWKCPECGEVYGEEPKAKSGVMVTGLDDEWRDSITAGMQVDDRGQTSRMIDETKKGDKGQMSMRIPSSVYHSRMKDDKDYWKDLSNVKRHSNWKL